MTEPTMDQLIDGIAGALGGIANSVEHEDERAIFEYVRSAYEKLEKIRKRLAALKVAG